MKKKIASLICLLVCAVAMTGCVEYSQYQSPMTQREGAKHLIKLTYEISGKNNYNGAQTSGTMEYTVEKAKYTITDKDGEREADVLRVTSVVKQDKNTLVTEVYLREETLEPFECRKTLTVEDTPSLNWKGNGKYINHNVEIEMEAENKELLKDGKGKVTVPYQGICYDSEQLILLVRAAKLDLELYSSLAVQTFNIQNGLSDGLGINVAASTVKLPVSVTGLQGGEYECMALTVAGTSFFAKASVNIKLTNDENRIPLVITQGETVYTLTAVEFGE